MQFVFKVIFSILILSLILSCNEEKSDQSQLGSSMNFVTLTEIARDYDNSIDKLHKMNLRKSDFQREPDGECRSEVYQFFIKSSKPPKNSPWIEYLKCQNKVESISVATTGKYMAITERLYKEAIATGDFEENFAETYEDGSFEKELSSEDYSISFAYSQEVIDDGTFAQTFNLMYLE